MLVVTNCFACLSKIINLNGYTYDRISKNNLLSTTVSEDRLNIGSASYQALLINDLDHSSPNILKKVLNDRKICLSKR